MLVDGGLRANVPVRQVRGLGADVVIAINVDQKLEPVSPDQFKQTAQLTNRLTSIVLDQIDAQQLENADLVIRPETIGISIYSKSPDDMRRAIEAGKNATTVKLPQIKEKLLL